MKYLKSTEIGKYYYCYIEDKGKEKWPHIFIARGDKGQLGYNIIIDSKKFQNGINNNSTLSEDYNHIIREATDFEKLWLDECIKKGQFIPREEMKYNNIVENFQIY